MGPKYCFLCGELYTVGTSEDLIKPNVLRCSNVNHPSMAEYAYNELGYKIFKKSLIDILKQDSSEDFLIKQAASYAEKLLNIFYSIEEFHENN